jgi:hypothetical protein
VFKLVMVRLPKEIPQEILRKIELVHYRKQFSVICFICTLYSVTQLHNCRMAFFVIFSFLQFINTLFRAETLRELLTTLTLWR